MVGVRVGADDHADVATGGAPDPLLVLGLVRAGIHHDVAGVRIAHDVAVGAGAGHHAGVGRRHPHQVLQQGHRLVGAPVQVVQQLAVGADQRQLAELHLVLHVARLGALHEAGPRATGPQWPVAGAGSQHRIDRGELLQPLQRADGREDDEELAGLVARQRIRGAHPHRLELLGLVGHGRLAFRHARDEERDIEAARQVAVGDPVGQHEHLVGGQHQAALAALVGEGRVAIE
jgi:hypothetical protein